VQVVGCLTLYLIFLHGVKMKIVTTYIFGLRPMNPGFKLSPVRVEFLVQTEVNERIFLRVLQLTHISIIPRIFCTHYLFNTCFLEQHLYITVLCRLVFMR